MLTPSMGLAWALITIGFVLLFVELFVPTFGVLPVVSVLCLLAGIAVAFAVDPGKGMVTLVTVAVVLPIVLGLGFQLWKRTPLGKRMFLHAPTADGTLATTEANLELEDLRGRIGRAEGPLRPSGTVIFDGRRVDVLTEGMMVDGGQWVRCIAVKAGKVIVRPIPQQPTVADLENVDFSDLGRPNEAGPGNA